MGSDFNILAAKIKSFHRKYNFYQFVKGTLLLVLLFVVLFLVLNFVEYKLFLSASWRTIIFFSLVLFFGLATLRFVIFPLIQMTGVIKGTNYLKISGIIRQYIPEIKDKLVNILELNDFRDKNYSQKLVEASISQKIEEIRFFDFVAVINLKTLRNLFFYLILSFGIVFTLYVADKNLISEPGYRFLHYKQEFVKPAPFEFLLINNTLDVKKGSSFTVKAACKGDNLPSLVYINLGGNLIMMKSTGINHFEYEIGSVIKPFEFYFTDLEYNSTSYRVEVIPVPVINEFKIEVISPPYTGLMPVELNNVGDLDIVAGSQIEWKFNCYDTDSLRLFFKSGSVYMATEKERGEMWVQSTLYKPEFYDIQIKNKQTEWATIMSFPIRVTDDFYPEIKVIQIPDSIKFTRFYFKGIVQDDYGFTRLAFHVNMNEEDSALALPVVPSLTPQEFYYTVDFQDYKFKGKTINYYFSVTDNDLIHQPKTTTSESFTFVFPDNETLEKANEEGYKEIESLMNESMQIVTEIKSGIKDLQLKNMNNDISDWEKSQLVNELVQKKSNLEDMLQRIEQMNQQMNNFNNTYQQQSEDILKKQELVEELLDDVMTDELRKLLEEFSKLSEEFDNRKLNELNKQMEISFDDLSKQLDRNLEMLKRMKVEQRLEKIVERTEQVQTETNQAVERLKKEGEIDKELKKTNDLMFELADIQQELLDILDENSKLVKPLIFDDFKEEFDDIKSSFQKVITELQRNSRKKSVDEMQESSDKLINLLFSMKQMLNSNSDEQNGEDIKVLQQILKNLLYFSFRQEQILRDIQSVSYNDPMMMQYTRQQSDLIDLSKVIKDSLYAMSLRTPQFGNVINNELITIEMNLHRIREIMGEGGYGQASTHQQLVMTAANNLALFLSDILRQMEEQQASAREGEENCEKGGKGGSVAKMKGEAENLRKQLQQMIDKLKNGEGTPMSREISESMMQHEMMQQMLRELINNGSVGGQARKQLQEVEQILEQNRRELANKRISPVLMQRHNQILTRLLEAEKSEIERDQDNKRESNSADSHFYSKPSAIFEKFMPKGITIETFQRKSLKLNSFYQNKYINYVERFNTPIIQENGD